MNKKMKKHMIFRDKTRAKNLIKNENISFDFDDIYEIIQNETKKSSNIHVFATSSLKNIAFEFVENLSKSISIFLVQIFKNN